MHGMDHDAAAARTPSLLPLSALAAALLLAGCAGLQTAPAQPVRVEAPATWSQADAPQRTPPTELAQWWRRFGDAQLTALVEQALQANTSVAGAIAALRQARAQADVTRAGTRPQVGTSASAQRSRQGSGSTRDSFAAGIDASWEPDLFGGQAAGVDASEAAVRASAAALGDVQVQVAAEVGLNVIALRSAQQRLAIAERNLALQQETRQLTSWRLQAGLVTALEAEQARSAVEQTRAALPALRTTIVQSRHALAVLTGQQPAALDAQLAAAAPLPAPPADIALDIPASTLRQRPDVRAAEAQVAAALARVAQAQADRLPSLRLSGSIGLNALTLGSLGAGPLAASVVAGISWPLFDGGAGAAQVRTQQAAFDAAEAGWRGAVLAALQDVEDALVALRSDRERQVRLEQAADAAANAADLARQRYASGLVDFQVVLDTQRTQLTAQDSLAAAGADIAADHVRLFKALGGGWDSRNAETIATR